MIMVIYGFGELVGGQIIGFVTDNYGGFKPSSKVSIFLTLIIYGSLLFCDIDHEYNFWCYFAGFWLGAADSAQVT